MVKLFTVDTNDLQINVEYVKNKKSQPVRAGFLLYNEYFGINNPWSI